MISIISLLFLWNVNGFIDYQRQYLWGDPVLYPPGIVGPLGKINYCSLEEVQQTPINYNPYLIRPCPSSYAALDWTWSPGIVSYTASNRGNDLNWVPNYLPGFPKTKLKNNFVQVPGVHEEYCLSSFHVHYGFDSKFGSEHSFDGQFPPMEMHYVHYGCEYGSLGEAAEAPVKQDPNKLAVVGVMFEIGPKDNPWFTQTFKFLDILRNAGGTAEIAASDVDISDIYPTVDGGYASYDNKKSGGKYEYGAEGSFGPYYNYEGGLTTPPCTPIVLWHSLLTPVQISEKQMMMLRTLKNDKEPYPTQQAPNYRQMQAQLSKTKTYECP